MGEVDNGVRDRPPTRASGNGLRKLSPSPTREDGVRNRSPTRAPGNGVRELPPSPTREDGLELELEQSKPSGIPRWLILDRIVHRSSRTTRCGVVEDDSTASELANDCVGRPVRASLRIAHPPGVSRLYLHCKGRPEIDCTEPAVIAAHRNSILFRLRVPFDDPMWWSSIYCFPFDYFVYSSSSSSPRPTLTLLPPCFHGGSTDTKYEKYFQPYRSQQQRTMLDKEMGILCHGEQGEFTVAEITCFHRVVEKKTVREVDLCLLHHPPPGSAIPIQWRVQRLHIPSDMKINLSSWWSDVVVPIDSTRLCWVDYYQGMLLIDVLTDSSKNQPDKQLLQFIPLPSQALKYRRPYRDAGSPDPLRCLCVTNAGIIKLVCILTDQPSPGPFTITAWTLHNIHRGGEWRKDVDTIMGDKEFFDLYGTGQSCLPLVRPTFPMVSLIDPDIICFLLEGKYRSFYIVEVNMMNKKLQSSALYVDEEEEEGYPPKRGGRNYFFGHNFIGSNFSSFLSENAITSWELSEEMQEAKRKRVMEKIGLEANLKK